MIIDRLIDFSIRRRWLMMALALGIALLGVASSFRLPIDAVPDITNVQVQINTEASGFTPLEVEQQITLPVELALAGLPMLDHTRSISRYGLSQVTVIFLDGTDIYFARQQVNERLTGARSRLPVGVEPEMGPVATGLGEIYSWAVKAEPGALDGDGRPYDATRLRSVEDWIIRPQIMSVPGVAEVNSMGGYERQLQITPDPARLLAWGIGLEEFAGAVASNNINTGAGYIEKNGQQWLVRAAGKAEEAAGIGQIVVAERDGVAVRVSDVATVEEGRELRTGAATEGGVETVLGTAMMLMGANSREVARAVDVKMEAVRQGLPPGVRVETVHDRTVLVDKAIATVEKNLVEGALLVIVILFLFLGNLRAALITAAVIPLSMLMTVTGMVSEGISANLMSLGALDFGLIVDGAVIMVENSIRRLAHEQQRLGRPLEREERFAVVRSATREVRQATLFGELIIIIVYLPILTLTGIEGRMFFPMAITVVIALASAMLLSMTFVPAAIALVLSRPVGDKESRLMVWTQARYLPTLKWSLAHPRTVIGGATALTAACLGLFLSMGREFIPSLDEGDIALHAMRIPGTGLGQAVEMQKRLESEIIGHHPEVSHVFSKIGTPDIATDPMPPNVADTFVMLKPHDQWPDPSESKAELIERLEKTLLALPGNNYEITQPIQMRFNELIAGVRSDLAVKVFGDDMEAMLATAEDVAHRLEKIEGAADVKVEQATGLPTLNVVVDRQRAARHGLQVAEVQAMVQAAVAGLPAGDIFIGDQRIELFVRLPEAHRTGLEAIRRIPVQLPGGQATVPLEAVAEVQLIEGPNQVSRQNGKRLVLVTANIRGRDIGSFVEEARLEIEGVVAPPPNGWLAWGGQFEQMMSAARRLQIVTPVALLLVFGLLFASFGSARQALLVFTGVPLALTGGVIALWVRGIPLSISSGVGFIALSGVAVLNGLVMVTFINQLRTEGKPLEEAIVQGPLARLRPVLMTALVASLGFVPMALATGTGAEVQRPLATVVIGGILSSTLLTLVVLPVLYRRVCRNV